MHKATLLGVVLSLVLVATGVYFGETHAAQAQTFEEYSIDPAGGPLRGSMGNRFLPFEDAGGTVRIVDMADADPIKKTLRVERILERKTP